MRAGWGESDSTRGASRKWAEVNSGRRRGEDPAYATKSEKTTLTCGDTTRSGGCPGDDPGTSGPLRSRLGPGRWVRGWVGAGGGIGAAGGRCRPSARQWGVTSHVVLGPGARPGTVALTDVADDGAPTATREVPWGDLPGVVEDREVRDAVRWVWDDTTRWYPDLLAAGVRVARCHDLRLGHTILRGSLLCPDSDLAHSAGGPWDALAPARGPEEPHEPDRGYRAATLFDDVPASAGGSGHGTGASPRDRPQGPPTPRGGVGPADTWREGGGPDPLPELRDQLAAVAGSADPGRLRLLLAAESAGALIAAELHHDGLPWRADVHDRLLTEALGPRPRDGDRPARLEELARQVRDLLGVPAVNLDSQPDLLRALRVAGVPATSTRKWELQDIDHPVIAPLLEYKRLARLLSANGWAWGDAWVSGGRFRPDYVPGGVVTGRWSSSGGGALQLPGSVRTAVRADPGWRLVVADAAQLEPRVLAAMSGDAAMAAAARHADLYQGVVDAGIVPTRQEAKYAMLGAIYGATTGPSAVLMPRLTAAYPRAVALVEDAARAGERGERVRTWLGRTSPLPGPSWWAAVEAAAAEGSGPDDARSARSRRRDWGRFTRNFVVQGTAAEWALSWMAGLRRRLAGLPGRPHLVFFLHDEVVVHAPVDVAEEVAAIVREAAAEAGRLLFGDFPVEFALSVAVVESYDQAK